MPTQKSRKDIHNPYKLLLLLLCYLQQLSFLSVTVVLTLITNKNNYT